MTHDPSLSDPTLRGRAVSAARGEGPFDVLIHGGRLLDVVTGRLRAADVGLVGPLIASVHAPDPSRAALTRIDATGLTVMPGLIDTHMHVESSMVSPEAYAAHVLPLGVTTALWDPHELANVCGLAGVDYACAAALASPMRLLVLAPSCVPSAPGFEAAGADFDASVIADLLARDDVHGLAEMMTMQPLLSGDARVKGIVDAGLASGKRVCGHARGLTGRDLNAYAAAGVESDHELTSAADLIARLEVGLTVELRGSHEHLLPEFVAALNALGHLPQTVTLCTDDVFPDDLLHRGALDRLMRILIAEGLPVDWVWRAATLNAARQIGRPDLGLVAPGRRADLLLVSNLAEGTTETVLVNGRVVARQGALIDAPEPVALPAKLRQTVDLPPFVPQDFEIPARGPRARIATLIKPRFPEWGERLVSVENGALVLPEDMIRMSVSNRYGSGAPTRVAVLESWGRWRGAYAATVSHDGHNLTCFGREPTDLAVAANAVREMQGGLAVVERGKVVARLCLPTAGLISDAPLAEVAADFADLRQRLDRLVDWCPPLLVFKALFGASLVCNAGPRLSDMGLVDPFAGICRTGCVLEEGLPIPG